MPLTELALRACSLSYALNKKSIGVSSRVARVTGADWGGLADSESEAGGESSLMVPLTLGESVMALPRKLGIGSDDGAGDAWNVAPAYAAADEGILDVAESGGVRRPGFAGPGDVETFFGRPLLVFLLFDFELAGKDAAGAGLPTFDFMGVAGKSGAKGMSEWTSFSDA